MSSAAAVADVVVVGAGVLGAAIFHELAATGRSVSLVERHRPGSGTTGSSGGVIRCYHDDDELADRAVEGWRFYRDFEKRTGVEVAFVESGFLYFPRDADRARRGVERLSARVPMQWLDAAEVARRFGRLGVEAGAGAVWEPGSGFFDAVEVVRALVRAGQAKGGRVYEGTGVRGLIRQGTRTRGVRTTGGPIAAGAVVLATGAGTPSLLDACGIPHDLRNQVIQVDLRVPAGPVTGHPAFLDEVHDLNGRDDPVSGGVYVGHPVDLRCPPRTAAGPVDPTHSQLVAEVAARRFGWVAGSRPQGGQRSVECFAPDDRGRVRALDPDASLVLATGLNGTGFRMAPWVAGAVTGVLDRRNS